MRAGITFTTQALQAPGAPGTASDPSCRVSNKSKSPCAIASSDVSTLVVFHFTNSQIHQGINRQ